MKKAQIQFMEMIFVLLILVVLIFIGIFIYFSFSTSSLEKKGEKLTDIDAVILSDALIGLPEITCGSSCIDAMKLIAFKKALPDLPDKDYYQKFFGNKKVTIEIIYPPSTLNPPPQQNRQCELGTSFGDSNYPNNCRVFIINTPLQPSQNIEVIEVIESTVSLYFPELDKHAIGLIKIEIFKK